MSREAVIVAVARTPIGQAFKGSLNNIKSPTLAAHAISAAVSRAGIDPGEVKDLVMGTVLGAPHRRCPASSSLALILKGSTSTAARFPSVIPTA